MLVDYSIPVIHQQISTVDHALPKGRYFNFLNTADAYRCTEHHYIASRTIGDQFFLEIKGTFQDEWHFTLRPTERVFWMIFQFLGTSIDTANGSELCHQQYRGFYSEANDTPYLLRPGKTWVILIGMLISSETQPHQEWPTLEPAPDRSTLPTVNIAHRNKVILEKIQQIKEPHFSLRQRLDYHMIQLMETYHGDLLEYAKSNRQDDVSLFHQAKEYIVAHYMDENIDVDRMAQDLLTSKRTLYRVFQENGLTINSAIQTIRIYKGREMLRRTNKSVDIIAFHLQFSTAKYFIKQYVKYFGHTPAVERKLMVVKPLRAIEDKNLP